MTSPSRAERSRVEPSVAERSACIRGISVIRLTAEQDAEERLPRCRRRNLLFASEISLSLSLSFSLFLLLLSLNCKRPPPLCNFILLASSRPVGSKRGKLRAISSFRSSTFFAPFLFLFSSVRHVTLDDVRCHGSFTFQRSVRSIKPNVAVLANDIFEFRWSRSNHEDQFSWSSERHELLCPNKHTEIVVVRSFHLHLLFHSFYVF